jgi:hypothetical protein
MGYERCEKRPEKSTARTDAGRRNRHSGEPRADNSQSKTEIDGSGEGGDAAKALFDPDGAVLL